jgi:CRISPR-associated protein (TIGR03986 family)
MATSTFSIVKIKGEKRLQIAYITAQKKYVQCSVDDKQLSLALLAKKQESIDSLRNVEVEFEEEENGQPIRVREKSKEWDHPEPVVEEIIEREIDDRTEGDFHNPYNFVPALPRDNGKVKNSELGDRNPLKVGMGHGVYQSDRWSGRIAVTLKTKTPLLIPDIFDHEVQAGEEKGHKTFPLRLGADGKPNLPPTSIKGMLRSAYEAVTNSRLSVFQKHSDRLAYRMSTSTGLEMVPARIVEHEGQYSIVLYTGTSEIRSDGTPDGATYAAWLPYYTAQPVKYSDGNKPQHGDLVTAWIELFQHHRWDRKKNKHIADCKLWRVRLVERYGGALATVAPDPTHDSGARDRSSYYQPLNILIKISGYVCVTNCNIDRKHDERIFFIEEGYQTTNISLNNEGWNYFSKQWEELITNYQENEDYKRNLPKPSALTGRSTTWSRHIADGLSETKLKHKTLCYAHVELDDNDKVLVKALYPVMISRGLFEDSPDELLSISLHPAINMEELSPADRVFGWVNQETKGKGAYKGNLRIHSVHCASDDSNQTFDGAGLPLAILGQPKPQQARFYAAKNREGDALEVGVKKEEGYGTEAKGLRGRKVYPHHRLPINAQEYSQTGRSDQNRSIRAWVKPETEFKFDIDITNLSDVELGGLLWLLSLPENHYHRLGGGKPFGFGSVSLAIDWGKTDLRNGQGWKEFYSELSLVSTSDNETAKQTIQSFKNQVVAVYGNNSFQNVKFIKAFCTSAKGFDDSKPVHYPRLDRVPNADSNIFEWFVENESTRGQRLSLPNLKTDRGLPYNP